MNNTIARLIDELERRTYESAVKEYEALHPAEQGKGAFEGSCQVHAETMLAYDIGRKIAKEIGIILERRYEESNQPDPDLTPEK